MPTLSNRFEVSCLKSFCFTAGTNLADLLWIATVLPYLKKGLSETSLIWECPIPEIQTWLKEFPEIDQVVGDVEELNQPPDTYLILNPFWHPVNAKANTPLEAVFSLISPWSPPPDVLPARPYAPKPGTVLPDFPQLPKHYICFDPQLRDGLNIDECQQNAWITLIAYLAIPAIQLGPRSIPLIPGMLDGRGLGTLETSALINQAQLFIGGDTGLSALAGALKKRQLWLVGEESRWWWPRGKVPECIVYFLNDRVWNFVEVMSLIWQVLSGGAEQRVNGL